MTERLFTAPNPSLFLTIGTFAAVPYVHLHLESRRRFYPDVPCLVHDDASPFGPQLQELCAAYGAHFFAPRQRHGHQAGDLAATLLAIQSAQALGVDLAVKMSCRFVPVTDWAPQLRHTACHTQYATYTHRDEGYNLGFRSECVAFHAPSWTAGDHCARMEEAVEAGREAFGIVEAFVHGLARRVHAETQCAANREYERLYPRERDTNAYGVWPWLGHDRTRRRAAFLWHNADDPLAYHRLSLAYGLDYRHEDFVDPNMGCREGDQRNIERDIIA